MMTLHKVNTHISLVIPALGVAEYFMKSADTISQTESWLKK